MTNAMLKPIVKAMCDAEKAIESGVAHDWTALGTAGVAVLMDVPAIVANKDSLQADLQALVSDPAADQDLLDYAVQQLADRPQKAVKIVAASADLLLANVVKIHALIDAIKS